MADARDKLAAAIANTKVVKTAAKEKKPAPKPAAPAAREKAPERPSRPPSGPPRGGRDTEPTAEKPKKKGLFTKSKKKKGKKEKKPAAKKKEQKPAAKEKKSGPGFLTKFVEELKDATGEIKPKALLATAAESLGAIKSMVSSGDAPDSEEPRESEETQTTAIQEDTGRPSEAIPEPAASEVPQMAAPADGPDPEPAAVSPAKVQRAPAKKAPSAQEEEAETPSPEAATDTPPSPQDPADEPDASEATEAPEAGATEPEAATSEPADLDNEAPQVSPAQVKRAQEPGGKKKQEAEEEEAAARTVTAEPDGEPAAADSGIGFEPPDASSTESEEIDEGTVQSGSEPSDRVAMDEEPPDVQPEADEGAPEPRPDPEPPAEAPSAGRGRGEDKPKRPKPPDPAVKLSKTEQALRLFHSLQILLKNPIWGAVVTDPNARPSALYSPRDRFDAQFSDQVFRQGLKAANKIAQAVSFDPEKVSFEEEAVEAVTAFPVTLDGHQKKDTDLLSELLSEDDVKKVIKLIKTDAVKLLLDSVGTRVGTFVPTIEILARIYLPMRKNNDEMIPGRRLSIQEEVLLRYKNSSYTDTKAKKARNLALNYFTDFLAGSAMKTFRERFDDSPDGQNNAESKARRHQGIKTHCFNLFEDRGTKLGLSSQSLTHLKARFSEMADLYFVEQVGDGAEELLEQFES